MTDFSVCYIHCGNLYTTYAINHEWNFVKQSIYST